MSETHKYYWLKLKRDFFKRHDIVIIEAMPNGKDYILFYLKLLCESVDHEGNLRFSETIPYSEDMLATITRTNVDIVRSAVKIFSELGMMEQFDDGTLFMAQVEGMIGSETNDAIRMRIARDSNKQLLIAKQKGEQCSEPFKNRSPELDIELEKELDIEKDKTVGKPPRQTFIKPSIEEIKAYCQERGNAVDPCRFLDFYESKGWLIGKNKMKDWRAAVRTWERTDYGSKNHPVEAVAGRSDAWTPEKLAEYGEELENALPATEAELAELERLKAEAVKSPLGRAIVGMLGRD